MIRSESPGITAQKRTDLSRIFGSKKGGVLVFERAEKGGDIYVFGKRVMKVWGGVFVGMVNSEKKERKDEGNIGGLGGGQDRRLAERYECGKS